MLLDNKIRCDVPAVLTALAGAYDVEGFDFAGARGEVCDFLVERWKYLGESSGYRYDEIAAVAETDVLTDPVMGEKKVKALSGFRTEARLPVLVQSAKRIRNILEQADKKEIAPAKFEAARLEAAAEKGLHEAAAAAAAKVQAAAEEGDYATALTALAELADPLETFFARETGVMVMVEDPALRDNRLALLRQIQETFRRVADFSQIVLEGEAA